MSGQQRTSGNAKSGRDKAVSSKVNDGRKSRVAGASVSGPVPGPPETKATSRNPPRRKNSSKNYLDSQRKGLVDVSPIAGVSPSFWKHVFAEVSAYRYPQFLHQLDTKAQEFEACQILYNLCKVILTKEECREAVKSRLQMKAQRGEIKIYSKEERV